MSERDDLIAWVTRNRPFLRGRPADEVAYFARMNNYSVEIVCEVLSHWHKNNGLDYRSRHAFGIGSEIHYLERSPLREQWRSLGKYLTTGEEWAA